MLPLNRPHCAQCSHPSKGEMPMPLDETLINDADNDFRQEGEYAATRLAISVLLAREARRDPMLLTEVSGRFDRGSPNSGSTSTTKTWNACSSWRGGIFSSW